MAYLNVSVPCVLAKYLFLCWSYRVVCISDIRRAPSALHPYISKPDYRLLVKIHEPFGLSLVGFDFIYWLEDYLSDATDNSYLHQTFTACQTVLKEAVACRDA
jgi:hypothetical protein